MTPEDRNWELAGQARMDGDREAERMYTNRARGLPDPEPAPKPCKWCKGFRPKAFCETLWLPPGRCRRDE